MFGKKPHLVYFGHEIYSVGISYYVEGRHCSTLAEAKAWIRKAVGK